MKSQVMRCPNCGKLYSAEEGACPVCYQPDAAQKAEKRGDARQFIRLLWIFAAFIFVPPLISLTVAYFALGWQTIKQNLSFIPILLVVTILWFVPACFVTFLALQKQKSILWGLLAFIIPISPIVTIPYLSMQKPRQVDWGHLALYALAIPLMFVGLLSAVVVWMG